MKCEGPRKTRAFDFWLLPFTPLSSCSRQGSRVGGDAPDFRKHRGCLQQMRIGMKAWLALLAALLAAGAIWMVWALRGSSEVAQESNSRRDHFRMVGEVEFEGERIVYDEVIQVRIDVGTISVMGLKKGDNRIFVSRLWVVRQLKNGGALMMEVPQAAGLFTDLERTDEPPEPNWTPENIRDFLRPPEEFLPEFRWVDNLEHPTAIEVYLAESYYAQEKARFRIIRPIRIEFVPPTPEAEATALSQMEAEPHWDFRLPEGRNWDALVAVAIPFGDLSGLPLEAKLQFDDLLARKEAMIPADVEQTIRDYARLQLNILSNYRSRGYGVPQPKKYPDGHGVLYRQAIDPTADADIPVSCDIRAKHCRVHDGETGYAIFYPSQFSTGDGTVTAGATAFQLRTGRSLIDFERERIVLIGHLWL